MKVPSTKRASTLFLKAVIIVIALAVLALAFFAFPNIWAGAALEWPAFTNVIYPGLIGIYLTVIPFLFALFQAFTLLQYIDKNNAFSQLSINALRNIKFSAIAMSLLYAAALPLAFTVAQYDDAPGLVLMAGAVVCSPLIIATFAAVLQKLVQNAVDMKSDIDLTI